MSEAAASNLSPDFSQRRHHILRAAKVPVQHLGEFAFRRYLPRKLVRVDKSQHEILLGLIEVLRLNPDSTFDTFPTKIVLCAFQNCSNKTIGRLKLEIE